MLKCSFTNLRYQFCSFRLFEKKGLSPKGEQKDRDRMLGSIRQMRSDRAKLDDLANPPLVAWRAKFKELGNVNIENFQAEGIYCFPNLDRNKKFNRNWNLPLPLLDPNDADFPSRLEMM